ncbi:hypothetical protein RQP46_010995 [Phenoliferia psychrophenolica]
MSREYITVARYTPSDGRGPRHEVVWAEGGRFFEFVGKDGERLTEDELNQLPGEPIPPDSPWLPLVTPEFPAATPEKIRTGFIKYSILKEYSERHRDPDCLGTQLYLVKREIETLGRLRANPHPNLCVYHGCLIQNNRLIGIVLEHYPDTLYGAFMEGGDGERVDRRTVCSEIAGAVDHLHSLGIVHNDVNPHNIALTSEFRSVLIDFDAARPEGYIFNAWDKRGTARYGRAGVKVSERANDLFGLERLREWIVDPEAMTAVLEQEVPDSLEGV